MNAITYTGTLAAGQITDRQFTFDGGPIEIDGTVTGGNLQLLIGLTGVDDGKLWAVSGPNEAVTLGFVPAAEYRLTLLADGGTSGTYRVTVIPEPSLIVVAVLIVVMLLVRWPSRRHRVGL